jgi:Ca2+-binding RTX toxin-like protein
VSYTDAAAAVSIDLTKASSTWTGDAQGDVFSSIEQLALTNFADTLRGNANANNVDGGGGDDQIFGAAGDDSLTGGSGNDAIQGGDGNDFVRGDGYAVSAGDDYLQGNAGDDVLVGNGGNDRLVGGVGNDTLSGGLGGDYLVGNEGADIFYYTAVEESQNVTINGVNQLDQIVDFTQDQDKIDLSGIDANPALDGEQAFTFIADPAHYTGDWTGVVWQTTAANGIATINVSIDGDSAPEMQIYMSHPYQFTANDFIL